MVVIGLFAAVLACGDNSKAQCTSDSDCPSATACEAAACQKSACVVVPLASGAVASEQVAGDCKLATCDGSGNIIQVPDDNDVPENTNPCVVAACSNGSPASYYEQADTTCGSGMFCNATGSCVACNGPIECPGKDTQCEARTCIDNACGMTYTPAGFKTSSPPQPAAGTCMAEECDGSGNAAEVIDNTNAPPTNMCQTGSCTAGSASITYQPSGTACTIGSGSTATPGTCNGSGSCT